MVMIGRCLVMVWAGLALVACTEPAGGFDDVGDETGETTDDPTRGLPSVSTLVIPMRPRTELELSTVLELVEEDGGPRLQFATRLDLARGEGYPDVLTVSLPSSWWATCGPVEGALSLASLEGSTDAVGVELADEATMVVRGHAEGAASIIGAGSITLDEEACAVPAGTTLPVDLSLTIAVRPADDARIEGPHRGCDGPIAVGADPSTEGNWFTAQLLDREGEPFQAANAEPDAQVSVELHGAFEAEHAEPDVLARWVVPSEPGEVEIVPAFGQPRTVEVVEAEAIVAATVQFQLAGTASGPLVLESGERYGEGGWGRAANRIAPIVVDADTDRGPLCSSPATAWFQLESLTPQVCTIVELPRDAGPDGYTFFGARTGQAARLVTAGTCTLSLDAPDVAAEAGFPLRLSAEFADPTGLHEF